MNDLVYDHLVLLSCWLFGLCTSFLFAVQGRV